MPVRVCLNLVYALLTKEMDGKQRDEFDTSLHEWAADNDRANRALFRSGDDGGGEG